MASKAIKVSESTYNFLRKKADESGESIKEVVDDMLSSGDISGYAGSWDMDDEEAERIRESRGEMWERWDP